jgi:hypothetical protein
VSKENISTISFMFLTRRHDGMAEKFFQVDKVVFLDNVQFKKRNFENRNKIRTHRGGRLLNQSKFHVY